MSVTHVLAYSLIKPLFFLLLRSSLSLINFFNIYRRLWRSLQWGNENFDIFFTSLQPHQHYYFKTGLWRRPFLCVCVLCVYVCVRVCVEGLCLANSNLLHITNNLTIKWLILPLILKQNHSGEDNSALAFPSLDTSLSYLQSLSLLWKLSPTQDIKVTKISSLVLTTLSLLPVTTCNGAWRHCHSHEDEYWGTPLLRVGHHCRLHHNRLFHYHLGCGYNAVIHLLQLQLLRLPVTSRHPVIDRLSQQISARLQKRLLRQQTKHVAAFSFQKQRWVILGLYRSNRQFQLTWGCIFPVSYTHLTLPTTVPV